MFFKKKSNVIFRDYASFGYIIDGGVFRYKKVHGNEIYAGDKILSESGSVFFSVLDRKPQSIGDLTKKIKEKYTDVSFSTLMDDAAELYLMLERDGFVVSGEGFHECEEKDRLFSYKPLAQDAINADCSENSVHSEKNTAEFFDEYFDGKPRLRSLHMEIISKCNERCIHCYIPHEAKIAAMDSALFYDILHQCKNMRVLHLTLSGGEPMLHKNFCDFLRKCREFDFAVSILSNLTLLTDDIIREMKQNSLLGVQTSLYSMNSEVHDEITKMKGSFDKTKNAIIRLIESDIPLQISCPIMKQNKNCYRDVAKWAEKYNVRVGSDHVIIGEHKHTARNLDCRLSIDEVEAVICEKSVDDENFFSLMDAESEKKKRMVSNDHVCSVCSSSICIAENGNVYPCAGWQGYVVGNVKECSLNQIWDGSEKVRYLRELRKSDFLRCMQCADRDYCTMCMVRNANEHPQGDPLVVSDYFCKVTRINKKLMMEWKKDLMRS